MFLLNGKRLQPSQTFRAVVTVNGEPDEVQFPSNWLAHASAEERARVGIQEVPDQPRPDDRTHFVSDNADGTFTATPRPVEPIRKAALRRVKGEARALLAATDWYVLRQAEKTTPVPPAMATYRDAIRAAANDAEAAIVAATTGEEIVAVVAAWPDDPNAEPANAR